MKYYFKFKFHIFMAMIPVFTASIIGRLTRNKPENDLSDVILLCLYILAFLILFLRNFRLIKLAIAHKPLLEFNEEFLEDKVMRMRYYWADIKEVVIGNDVIEIYFYDIEKYLTRTKGFWLRWWVIGYRKKYFRIASSQINQKDLQKNMNDYSISSTH